MLTARVLLAPHVPTLLVDEHRGHGTEMLEAFGLAARGLAADAPEAVVVLSARWRAPGPFLADGMRRHATLTDYYGFGVEVRYDCQGEPALARALVETAQRAGVRAATAQRGVDSGVTVPMHFLARRRLPLVPVSLARATADGHRAWGAALRAGLEAWRGRVAFVVGGMLSHNEHAWNLRREVPAARAFDERVLEALAGGAWGEVARLGAQPDDKAQPEAGLMHLQVLRGLLGGDLPGQVLCYEPGPGMGAALVEFLVGEPVPVPPDEELATTPDAVAAGGAGARPPKKRPPVTRVARYFEGDTGDALGGGRRAGTGPRPGAGRGPRPGPSRGGGPRRSDAARGPRPGPSRGGESRRSGAGRGPRPGPSRGDAPRRFDTGRGPRPGPSRGGAPRRADAGRGPRPGPSRGDAPRRSDAGREPRPGGPGPRPGDRGARPGGPGLRSGGPDARPGAARRPRPGAGSGPRPGSRPRRGPGPGPGSRPGRGPGRGPRPR